MHGQVHAQTKQILVAYGCHLSAELSSFLCRRMPTSELVRYSGLPKTSIRAAANSGLQILKNSDSSSFGSGGEDWITRKRVETKTVKNIEKRIQRQVVLEDGRVIEEDDPEITVDTIEDVESHSDDCDDDVKHIGSLVHVRKSVSTALWENLQ